MIAVVDRLSSPETAVIPEAVAARPRGGGPRTPEGKEQSKRNSLKHGLRAKVILPEDLAAAVAARTEELSEEYEPRSPYEEWLVGEMALATARLDRCAEMSLADMVRGIKRATLCWEADRRRRVEDLGARLPKDPARVAQALGRSKQGADWKIERWDALGDCLRANGGWDEAQRRLAFDLLGVPLELRNGSTKVPPEGDSAALAALVARQVARLRQDKETMLDELDAAEQAMAASGTPSEEDAASARLRKYEASCRRSLLWAQAEFLRARERSSRPEESPASKSVAPMPPASQEAPDRPANQEEEAVDQTTPFPLAPTPRAAFEAAPPLNRGARRAEERMARQASHTRA